MLTLQLTWNQKAVPRLGTVSRSLHIRPRLDAAPTPQPGAALVLLDRSSSMSGRRMEGARAAVAAVHGALRPGDHLAVLAFDHEVQPALPWTRSDVPAADVRAALASVEPRGATRLDLALADAAQAVQDDLPKGAAPQVFLITDGVPTDARGRALSDRGHLLDQAAGLAAAGASVSTVGFGDAADYDAVFLTELANRGTGNFLPAPTAEALAEAMKVVLHEAQAAQLTRAQLFIESTQQVSSVCRIQPSYCPLDLRSAGVGKWMAALGALEPDAGFLVEFEVYTPGHPAGRLELGTVRLTAEAGGERVGTEAMPLALTVADPGRRLHEVHEDTEQLCRIREKNTEEVRRAKADSPAQRAVITKLLRDNAALRGDAEDVARYEAEFAQLIQDLDLSAEALAQGMTRARYTRKLPPSLTAELDAIEKKVGLTGEPDA